MGDPSRHTNTPAIVEIVRRTGPDLRAKIGDLADITAQEIRAHIPEYTRPGDEQFHRAQRASIERALLGFLDTLEDCPDDTAWRAVYRAIGARERREGRTLDALHAAMRIGARMGWRLLVEFAEAESLPVSAVGEVTDAIWAHVDRLIDAAEAGYAEARAAEIGELDWRRRRLLDLLVADPPAGQETLSAAATAAHWPLPQLLIAVAVEPIGPHGSAHPLSPDVLADLERAEPALIVPEPPSRGQLRTLLAGLRRYRIAVGPAVPPGQAADSMRWARRTLDLACRGIIRGGAQPEPCLAGGEPGRQGGGGDHSQRLGESGLVWSEDHLAVLTIFQDEALLACVVERRLKPLATARQSQREALAETLLSWLQHNMNASAVAMSLRLHPQTVRRRLRQLHRLFGDQVRDSNLRFELEIALRAEQARREERQRRAVLPDVAGWQRAPVAGAG